MLATLFAVVCAANLCHADAIAEMPFGACITQAGQEQAVAYAKARGETFQSWKCEVGRRA